MRIFPTTAAIAAMVVLVAGCGGPQEVRTLPISAPAASVPTTVCTTVPADAQGVSLPAGFQVAWVLRCSIASRTLAGNGKWQMLVSERADTSATDLVAALEKPSQPRATNVHCPYVRPQTSSFVLVDGSGRGITPAVPTLSCGQPPTSGGGALDALKFHEIYARPLGRR
ncbi:hypothetical protein [Fodinicola feengrottensis]|uniref:hypothetical protein n=1 Tax=Fodinicola feengrottensis TaxID=435914 RepID=UPI0013D55C59|nr:hypothetical protein [Fodinicola feengrottensis]